MQGQMPRQEPEKLDPKKMLEETKTRIHNIELSLKIEKAVLEKLLELAR